MKRVFAIILTLFVLVGLTTKLFYWQKDRHTKAVQKLKSDLENKGLTLRFGTSLWKIKSSDITLVFDYGASVSDGNRLIYTLSENQLIDKISTISAEIDIPAADPEIKIVENLITVSSGENGQKVDERRLVSLVRDNISKSIFEMDIPVVLLKPKISQIQVEKLQKRAENLLNKMIILTHDGHTWNLESDQLISWLDPDGWKTPLIETWVSDLSLAVNVPPQNAHFKFIGTGKVEEFLPAKPGVVLNDSELVKMLLDKFTKLEKEIQSITMDLPVKLTEPDIKTSDVNKLGIEELIGRGLSDASGSIPNRLFNVGKAAESINGILVAPNEVFSFIKYIGDISAATGYKPAYIIKDGRTVLGDGGGVCQVSTTLFRTVLNAGLPILERTAHAYRVHYYENDSQPGFDATVFSPSVDLKFKNDTGNYILIQTAFDKKTNKLVIDFYGTKDGRGVTLSKARIWDVTPPPPAIYQDGSTLNRGIIQQVDWPAWGTKSAFDWKVTRNGETLQERTFYSNYRPWQAVYLRGTR
ncbi:VanW family protein [Candidatus Amesbacteria bacterium]|nr:VanW family protein [Candidatus Amesbacteria bacterium]